MVYFSNGQITIRNMECKDAPAITDAEIEQGWDATIEKYQKRLGDQQSGKAISLVAEYSGKPVGYIKCTLGISLRLLLRLIFRQMHPNLINVRSTYAS